MKHPIDFSGELTLKLSEITSQPKKAALISIDIFMSYINEIEDYNITIDIIAYLEKVKRTLI